VRNCIRSNVRTVGEPRITSGIIDVADPGFRSPGNLDYSLSPNSPIRGRATDGSDPGYRPREALKAAMEIVGRLQLEARQPPKR
jgi:hypothetical protein